MRSFYQHSIQPLEVLTIDQNVPVSATTGWRFSTGGVGKLLQIGSTYNFGSGPYQTAVGFVDPDFNIYYGTSGNKTMKLYNKGLFNIRGSVINFYYTQNIELDGLVSANLDSINHAIGTNNPNVKKLILKNTKNIQSSLFDDGGADIGIELNNTTTQSSLTDIRIDFPYYDFITLGTTSPLQIANISAITFNYQYGMQPSISKTYAQNRLDVVGTKIKNLDLSYVKFSNNGLYRYQSNTQLTGITLGSQNSSVSQFHAYGCDLGYVNFKPVTGLTSINNCGIRLDNNNMTAAEVNQILYDLNNLSVGGYTGRTINIGGTNASPTSGGTYDGIAARNALISKLFTVTI